MKDFVYNPIENKYPSGVCLKKGEITYLLKVRKHLLVKSALFVIHRDEQQDNCYPMQLSFCDEWYTYFTYTQNFNEAGFYWYHFEVDCDDGYFKLFRGEDYDLSLENAGINYLQLVINKDSSFSLQDGIIYHIFVDRFNRFGKVNARKGLNLLPNWDSEIDKEYTPSGERCNINCYGGNFKGIIKKLDYLKSLNVKMIYLSPIFEANSSHKYDVACYSRLDSMFGTEKDFINLVTEAQNRGISIIIDGVFNHTGSDSEYFNREGRYPTIGAYQSKNSKYYSWYDFYDDSYSCWWGVKTLPQTKEDSSFFDFISGSGGIIEKYMLMGISGFRLDVVDELSNRFSLAISKRARKVNKNAFMVGEVWEDASCKIAYGERKNYFLGDNLDSVTNYPMKKAILNFVKYGNEQDFKNTISMILDQYPKGVQNNLMNILDTHDTARAITFLGVNRDIDYKDKCVLTTSEYDIGKQRLKMATVMQYTIMGIPTVFYGDEAGVQGTLDPYCRATYPWGKEDKELIKWYVSLGRLRQNKTLSKGEFSLLYAKDGVLAYKRQMNNQKVIVVLNRSSEPFEFDLEQKMTNYFDGNDYFEQVLLKPNQFLVLIN